MIIRGGENIYPRKIEQVLFGHPTVADVAEVGVPDPKWESRSPPSCVPHPARLPPPRSCSPAHRAWAGSSCGGPAVKALRNSVTAALGGSA